MAYETKKGSNFHVGPWWCTFSDSLQICIARLDTLFRHPVGQVVYLFPEETTLRQLQFEIIFPESIKHYTQMIKVFLCSLQEHDQIIQVDQTVDEV